MKNLLTHFQKNLITGLILLCNVAVLPNNLVPTINDSEDSFNVSETVDEESTETSEENPDNDKDNEDNSEKDPENPDPEKYDFGTDLIINAINPGYTVDKVSNVGEFIELQNLTDAQLVLAGYTLKYTNSAGTSSTLYTFPEGSYMTGKHLLLRYSGAPEKNLADIIYKGSGLAMKAGTLTLEYGDETIDGVCWGSEDCYPKFENDNSKGTVFRTTLVRNLTTGYFDSVRTINYEPTYDPENPGLYIEKLDEEDPEENIEPNLAPQCRGLQFSELLTYYAEDKSEQFIELFNSSNQEITLDGCKINFKKKDYELSGTISPGQYYAFYQSELFTLTKNPKNPVALALIDVDNEVLDEITYSNGQKKSSSYARTFDEQGQEKWQVTYAITPNAENIYQKFRNCEEGKIINEATGNCVKVTTTKTAQSTKGSTSKTLAPCPEGQYRNPLTNRCKKITSTSSSTKECAEGYERNPETNRCRKIKTPNNGEEYALVPNTHSDQKVFVGIGIVIIIAGLGLVYVILQFRREIARTARVVGQRFNRIRKDLFARGFGGHRNKKS